jgi:hypothetical protein
MNKKPLTRFEKYEREESKARLKLYDLEKEKEKKQDELNTYYKRHRSMSFDLLKTCDVAKLNKIYAYFDKNKSYIHESELGLRCDDRGMKLHFWLHNDPDYLVLHLSSNHNNIVFSGSTSWIIKAPTLEDKVNVLKTVKTDISKIIQNKTIA